MRDLMGETFIFLSGVGRIPYSKMSSESNLCGNAAPLNLKRSPA
ncbi:hypothetical protein [Burkholderia ubonensis]|nr:hypothetical protein [Burkholderia ubonensis]